MNARTRLNYCAVLPSPCRPDLTIDAHTANSLLVDYSLNNHTRSPDERAGARPGAGLVSPTGPESRTNDPAAEYQHQQKNKDRNKNATTKGVGSRGEQAGNSNRNRRDELSPERDHSGDQRNKNPKD